MRFWEPLLACTLLACLAAVPARAEADCRGLDWTKAMLSIGQRELTPDDLVRLRDVGPLDVSASDPPLFTVSPDHRRVAFQVRQADPSTNAYCLGMVILSLDGATAPIFVDTGGELIRRPVDAATVPEPMTGVPAIVTPRWSLDGSLIFFLKHEGGTTQIWAADSNGRGSRAFTRFGEDVLDFRVDGGRIVARVRGDTQAARAALDQEARTGFHFDSRFMPLLANEPAIPVSPPVRYLTVDSSSAQVGEATPAEVRQFDIPPQELAFTNGRTSQQCVVERRAISVRLPLRTSLELQCAGAAPTICPLEACRNTTGPLWQVHQGTAVRFMRREGWADSRIATYEWEFATNRVRQLDSSPYLLIGCQPRDEVHLLCLRETSLRPRHLVSIDLATRAVTVIADPNPEIAGLLLGRVQRILLRSNASIEAFADIVLPVHYRRGRRYPLIVVQYQSRGFLRGGTGDEFPIQAFANRGFAILSVERPAPIGTRSGPKTYVEMDRLGLRDFADRRSVLSVVEQGVRRLIARGIVARDAIGITGLSDGSSTVQFAALNSHLFAAAAVSGCCWEPDQTALLGPTVGSLYARIGWPGVSVSANSFWSHLSLARNAKRIAFPILFQEADEEFRAALASYTALREVGKPADLFVYPNESHFKWQPVHRLATYERSLDWFAYWLKGERPADPRRLSDVERWAAMRASFPRPTGQDVASVRGRAVQPRTHASVSSRSRIRT